MVGFVHGVGSMVLPHCQLQQMNNKVCMNCLYPTPIADVLLCILVFINKTINLVQTLVQCSFQMCLYYVHPFMLIHLLTNTTALETALKIKTYKPNHDIRTVSKFYNQLTNLRASSQCRPSISTAIPSSGSCNKMRIMTALM